MIVDSVFFNGRAKKFKLIKLTNTVCKLSTTNIYETILFPNVQKQHKVFATMPEYYCSSVQRDE